MGYLSDKNNEIIVDAILTKYGREKMASGQQLGITKFALSDDEIDYSLYNPNHPMGSDYFDIAIRKLPMLEPVANAASQFKYALYSNSSGQNLNGLTLGTGTVVAVAMGPGAQYIIPMSLSNTQLTNPKPWYSVLMSQTVTGVRLTAPQPGPNAAQDLKNLYSNNGNSSIYKTNDSTIAYGEIVYINIDPTVNGISPITQAQTITLILNVENYTAPPATFVLYVSPLYTTVGKISTLTTLTPPVTI